MFELITQRTTNQPFASEYKFFIENADKFCVLTVLDEEDYEEGLSSLDYITLIEHYEKVIEIKGTRPAVVSCRRDTLWSLAHNQRYEDHRLAREMMDELHRQMDKCHDDCDEFY